MNGMLSSIDANQGDILLGWDADQFPSDVLMSLPWACWVREKIIRGIRVDGIEKERCNSFSAP